MERFTPSNFTPEQAAAYVNATCMVVLSELLSMHWKNEEAKAAGKQLPFPGQAIQDRIRMHCVTHENVMELFERAKGNPPGSRGMSHNNRGG